MCVPPGFSPNETCLGRGWEVSRGCARDVVYGIQTMSAWVSLHPVQPQAIGSPAQASLRRALPPAEQNAQILVPGARGNDGLKTKHQTPQT